MAKRLANTYGSELDRVNCPFYWKVGACRHGDRCSRHHLKPVISPTLLLSNIYQRPDMIVTGVNVPVDPKKVQEHFEDFYEDIFEELNKYGKIKSLDVCDNVADHMVGNVYVQFGDEDEAANAFKNLTGRFYSGRPIIVEFSPVTEIKEATCRQYEEETCNRGGYCNFMHRKIISRELRRQLFGRYPRNRSRSPDRRRSHGSRSHSRRYDDDQDYRDSRSSCHANGRNRRPRRAGSEEKRAVYEQWNRKREEAVNASKADRQNGDDYDGHELPRQALKGY